MYPKGTIPPLYFHSCPPMSVPALFFLFHPPCLFLLSNTPGSISALLAPILPPNSSPMFQSFVPLPPPKTLPYFLFHLFPLHCAFQFLPLPPCSPQFPRPLLGFLHPPPLILHAVMPAFLQAAMAPAPGRQRENQSWHCTVLEWEEIKNREQTTQTPESYVYSAEQAPKTPEGPDLAAWTQNLYSPRAMCTNVLRLTAPN